MELQLRILEFPRSSGAGLQSSFGRNACGRTTAAAHNGNSKSREQFTGRTRQIECGRSGFSASEDAHLSRSAGGGVLHRVGHVVLFPFLVFAA